MGERARFDVEAAVGRDLRHTPYLLDGLAALAADGALTLRLTARRPRRHPRGRVVDGRLEPVATPYPWVADLVVTDHEAGSTRRVAVDLQDWRDLWGLPSLRTADVVLRRMHTAPEVAVAEAATGTPVRPAGITGAGDAARWAGHRAFRRAAWVGRLEAAHAAPGRLVPRRPTRTPVPAAPVAPTTVPDRPAEHVFFQVAHHDWGASTEARRLNDERATLIRALRSGLGDRFVGGMTFAGPVPPAYADVASTLPTRRDLYLQLVADAAVVVAGNGFGGSPPWKLAEYLERGCCIVAEPPAVTLPAPLVDGTHLRLAATPDDVVARCEGLLADPVARRELGANARAYHEAEVAPVALARRALTAGSEVAWAA